MVHSSRMSTGPRPALHFDSMRARSGANISWGRATVITFAQACMRVWLHARGSIPSPHNVIIPRPALLGMQSAATSSICIRASLVARFHPSAHPSP
jgi:hypothetical protein